MKILVACEFSGIVRDAFTALGHDATSADLLPSDTPGKHHQGDVLEILGQGWDLMVAHPPCTYLTNSGVRWLHDPRPKFANRWELMREGAEFFKALWEAPIERIAVENPIMHGYAVELTGGKATQYVQPWQHGHTESKKTGLRLKNLPRLTPTEIVYEQMMELPYKDRNKIHYMSPGPERWKERSRTYTGIAKAMADQWGNL